MRRSLIVLMVVLTLVTAVSAEDKPMTIALPPDADLTRLAEMTAKFTEVSMLYNPEKLKGKVKLSLRGDVTREALWDVFNQALVSQGFTTVVSGVPPVYQVVTLSEAAALGAGLSPEQQAKLSLKPGYSVIVHPLTHISTDQAVKTLAVLFTEKHSQIRAMDANHLVLTGTTPTTTAAQALLATLDQPGLAAEARLFRPQGAGLQQIQTAALTAWASMNKISSQPRQAEIQQTPDGQQLLLLASKNDIDELEKLLTKLDTAEPNEVRNYRPRFFSLEEVSSLIGQVLKKAGQADAQIVLDKLTNSLVITATKAQHERIAEMITKLDEAPAASRRQARTFIIQNRQVDELAGVLQGLITSGIADAQLVINEAPAPPPEATTSSAGGAGTTPGTPPPGQPTAKSPTSLETPKPVALPPAHTGGVTGKDAAVLLTTDPTTNRIIAFGDSRQLDQIGALIKQLDLRQPQVELEVIMTTLTDSQTRALGTELAARLTRGEISASAVSLFGLSSAPGSDVTARTLATGAGFGGMILNPGDYAVVVHALETVNKGDTLIRSKVLVTNNAKATVNGIVQQPISSINTGDTIATTSFGGTSDAGTQLTLSPQISAGDAVTLTYQISQSSFIGSATITAGGAAIPAPKRNDSLSSVATIPDGHTIALGGLSNLSATKGASGLPFLSSIPILGYAFKNETKENSVSRFYIFIHANIMRHENFKDLMLSSEGPLKEAKMVDESWPTLEPVIMK